MTEKIDFGIATEDDVQRFVERAFGVDFVFRSPFHEKGHEQKETTDVLAVFDDVAVPIQVKAQAYNADGSARAEDVAWMQKNLRKAVSQVTGAVRTLKGTGVVRLENIRRGSLEFQREKAHYFYGVVVLNHVSKPFLPEEMVPEIANAPFPIHVFSFADFYNLARIFDTHGDLTGYLEMRADVIVPTLKPKVHAEKAAFEFYLKTLRISLNSERSTLAMKFARSMSSRMLRRSAPSIDSNYQTLARHTTLIRLSMQRMKSMEHCRCLSVTQLGRHEQNTL
jgi:hypothetical protein